MYTVALISALDYTSTSAEYQLGAITSVVDPTYGLRFWRYIFNNSGSNIAANLGVMQENGTTPYEVSLSTTGVAAQRILGVTQHAIANGYYGWVLCDGIATLTSDGSTTADTPQQPVANGKFSDGTVGTHTIAAHSMATESPAGDGGTLLGMVRFL